MSLFEDYTVKLCTSSSYDESFDAYCKYIESIGYQSVTYFFIPRIALDNGLLFPPQFSASKETNFNYLKHYAEARYGQKDNIIEKIEKGYTETIDWWEEARNKKLTPEQEQILHTMRYDYQIINGLSIPTPSGNKGIGISAASVVSGDNDRLFQKLKKETQETLRISAILFHNHAVTNAYEFHVFIDPLLASFSETEKKVIKALPKGTTVSAIAAELGRSVRYIDNVIRELRKKVGGETAEGKPRISTGLLIYYIGLMRLVDQF